MVGDWEHALAESGSPVRMPELGLRSDFLSGPTQQGRTMNVLFVTESERGCWQLVSRIEALGCRCWFASNPAEIRRIIEFCDIGLVLSTRPVTEGSQLMSLLKAPKRTVFYSFPVEDSCLWFQAIPAEAHPHISAIRPSEFMSILDNLCSSSRC